ncbi:MAG: hypothetical protein PF501_15620 [Salinisphaera sp.]|jgi:hypothetical protein|nr:hypothetical protein [Salinisphaera sp.]
MSKSLNSSRRRLGRFAAPLAGLILLGAGMAAQAGVGAYAPSDTVRVAHHGDRDDYRHNRDDSYRRGFRHEDHRDDGRDRRHERYNQRYNRRYGYRDEHRHDRYEHRRDTHRYAEQYTQNGHQDFFGRW